MTSELLFKPEFYFVTPAYILYFLTVRAYRLPVPSSYHYQRTVRATYYTWCIEPLQLRIFMLYGQDCAAQPTYYTTHLPLRSLERPQYAAASRLSGPLTYALPAVTALRYRLRRLLQTFVKVGLNSFERDSSLLSFGVTHWFNPSAAALPLIFALCGLMQHEVGTTFRGVPYEM